MNMVGWVRYVQKHIAVYRLTCLLCKICSYLNPMALCFEGFSKPYVHAVKPTRSRNTLQTRAHQSWLRPAAFPDYSLADDSGTPLPSASTLSLAAPEQGPCRAPETCSQEPLWPPTQEHICLSVCSRARPEGSGGKHQHGASAVSGFWPRFSERVGDRVWPVHPRLAKTCCWCRGLLRPQGHHGNEMKALTLHCYCKSLHNSMVYYLINWPQW